MLEAEKASATGGSEKEAMKVAWHKGDSEGNGARRKEKSSVWMSVWIPTAG